MFDSARAWLEGLFRPVLRVSSRGDTYIERTPTLTDISVLERAQQFTRDCAENSVAVTTFTELLSATDRPIHIRYMSCLRILSTTYVGWQIADRPGVQSDEISQLDLLLSDGVRNYELINAADGIIVPQGKNFYLVQYLAAAGARTVRAQVQYVRL